MNKSIFNCKLFYKIIYALDKYKGLSRGEIEHIFYRGHREGGIGLMLFRLRKKRYIIKLRISKPKIRFKKGKLIFIDNKINSPILRFALKYPINEIISKEEIIFKDELREEIFSKMIL